MLECEIDDILHWGSIGAIDLHLMLNEDRYAEIDPLDSFLDDIKSLPSERRRNHQSHYRLSKYLNASVTDTTTDVLLSGLCKIHRSFIEFAYNQPHKKPLDEWVCSIKEDWSNNYFTIWHNESLTPLDLFITKPELVKLHQSITTGRTLKNKFDDGELFKQDLEEKNRANNNKPERLTGGLAKSVVALTDLVLRLANKDSALMNNPHKLHTTINQLLIENKANPDGCFDLGITDNAYRDLIAKGRSAHKVNNG